MNYISRSRNSSNSERVIPSTVKKLHTTHLVGVGTMNKMKTEMCQTILNGNCCKYGSACTFAHTNSELATMGERQEKGKLDLATFKRCQCFTQLSTGVW